MARKNGPSILQEELYPPPDQPVREEMDDARLLDLDVEQESPFLRGQKRVRLKERCHITCGEASSFLQR